MQFRQKPVVIEAIQINSEMSIKTVDGILDGNPGDWLITEPQGKQYFCEDSIFQQTYEAVTPQG